MVLPQGWGTVWGTRNHAQVPPEDATGSGPRFPALIGAMAGTHGTRRRLLHQFCASGLQVSRRRGAMPKRIDRVAPAIAPPDGAIAPQARQAPGHASEATSWCLTSTLQGLWVRGRDTAAFSMLPPHRSQEAVAALSDDWAGLLVRAGDGVDHTWVAGRQTCLAHLIRPARGVAERQPPDLAACGAWAWAEFQRLCPRATAPPTGGEWRAWSARRCPRSNQSPDRQDEAGKCARRRRRQRDSLWVFLAQHGVDPTNHRAERAWRCGVLWRTRSQGTARVKGNRWVERLLSLQETCRLHARST